MADEIVRSLGSIPPGSFLWQTAAVVHAITDVRHCQIAVD
jgi:hypothetical protein